MKKQICLVGAIMILFSCSDTDEEICGINKPTEDLSWLKNEIVDRDASTQDLNKYFYIVEATFKFRTVFIFENCCPFCNTAIFVYDCGGNRIVKINDDIQRKDIKNTEVIYKPKDFACGQS